MVLAGSELVEWTCLLLQRSSNTPPRGVRGRGAVRRGGAPYLLASLWIMALQEAAGGWKDIGLCERRTRVRRSRAGHRQRKISAYLTSLLRITTTSQRVVCAATLFCAGRESTFHLARNIPPYCHYIILCCDGVSSGFQGFLLKP